MPITASPHPRSRPSTIAAMIPRRSSVGWLGWSRTASRPGSPIVERKAVTFEHFDATRTRSWFPMILLTAATISGVSPQATSARSVVVVSSDSSQSRSSPTVIERIGANASSRCWSWISRVTSSISHGTTGSSRKAASSTSARQYWAATRSSCDDAAIPASSSPERRGDARASTVRRSAKRYDRPARVTPRVPVMPADRPGPSPIVAFSRRRRRRRRRRPRSLNRRSASSFVVGFVSVVLVDEVLADGDDLLHGDLVLLEHAVTVDVDTGDRRRLDDVGLAVAIDVVGGDRRPTSTMSIVPSPSTSIVVVVVCETMSATPSPSTSTTSVSMVTSISAESSVSGIAGVKHARRPGAIARSSGDGSGRTEGQSAIAA